MELIDTHCHLYSPPLFHDPAEVVSRARARGVTRIIVPAYDRASWDACVELARLRGVRTALGIHPWVAHEPFEANDLSRALTAAGAVAVGEIGLDSKEGPPLDRQLAVLHAQLEIAISMELPVILHCRGWFEELLVLLAQLGSGSGRTELEPSRAAPVSGGEPEESRARARRGVPEPPPHSAPPRLRGVVHAFSRGPDLARRFLDLGLHIAFGGAVTRPRSRAVQSAAVVPDARLLLETDAPSIGLEGIPAERTEPAHVRDVAAALAAVRGDDLETVARRTTANAVELFRL